MQDATPARRLNRREASDFLRGLGYPITAKTLAKYAVSGEGPAFLKFGTKMVLYTEPDLRAWAEGRCTGPHRSTSEVPHAAEAA
jgi:hypothetical protein